MQPAWFLAGQVLKMLQMKNEFGATDTTQKTRKTAESYFLIINYGSKKLGLTGTKGTPTCKNQII